MIDISNLKGKTIESIVLGEPHHKQPGLYQEIWLVTKEGETIIFTGYDSCVDILVKAPLSSDVIPIGANTLGEGSV